MTRTSRHRAFRSPRGARRLSTVTLSVVTALGCRAPDTQSSEQEASGVVPDQVMVDVKTTLTDELGARRSYLLADSGLSFDQDRRVEFRRVRLTFFGEESQQLGIVTAQRAVYRIDDGTLDLLGDAAITLGTGTRLTAPRLRYDPRASVFTGDTTFTLEARTGKITGTGFTSNLRLSDLTRGIPKPRPQRTDSTAPK